MKIRIIKILSVIILTISAIVGLLFDFKDANGHLTIWGIVALVISVTSGLTAVAVEILEYRTQNEEKKLSEVREKERKRTLSEIQSNIISSNSPLIPFRLLYTLKYLSTTSEIEDAISNSIAIKSVVKTEFLKLVGTARLSEEPFNYEKESPEKLHCTIKDRNSLDNLIEKQKLLILPHSIEIQIYTTNSQESPSIILNTDYETPFGVGKVKEARIYDNVIYQDTLSQHWELKTSQVKIFGVKDLLRSRIKVKASFFITDRTNDKDYPRFTNLLLYFGDSPVNLLSFKIDELLSKQFSGRESESDSFFKFGNDLAKQFFQELILEFEITITDEIYNNQIKRFA